MKHCVLICGHFLDSLTPMLSSCIFLILDTSSPRRASRIPLPPGTVQRSSLCPQSTVLPLSVFLILDFRFHLPVYTPPASKLPRRATSQPLLLPRIEARRARTLHLGAFCSSAVPTTAQGFTDKCRQVGQRRNITSKDFSVSSGTRPFGPSAKAPGSLLNILENFKINNTRLQRKSIQLEDSPQNI